MRQSPSSFACSQHSFVQYSHEADVKDAFIKPSAAATAGIAWERQILQISDRQTDRTTIRVADKERVGRSRMQGLSLDLTAAPLIQGGRASSWPLRQSLPFLAPDSILCSPAVRAFGRLDSTRDPEIVSVKADRGSARLRGLSACPQTLRALAIDRFGHATHEPSCWTRHR